MLTHRKWLLLASGALAALPMLLWAPAAPAQQQPYPPPQNDAYRPPAKAPYAQNYTPPGSQPYNGPGQPHNGPGQPYGPPNDPPPGNYNQPHYGQQGPYGQPHAYNEDNTYSSSEIIQAGHSFFGAMTQGLARVIEYAFQKQGRPNGYILGQDAGGAFVAGLRYGEGMLYTKDAGNHRVYWQGPSIGWDAGGDGSKVMVLVYNLRDPSDIYRRFGGIDGSAYMVGGVGMTFQQNGGVVTAPIRTGIGLRLGANVGYLKYTRAPTWNPF
jgi:hypothetical protein